MLRIQAEALTFDDVSLVPAHSTVLPKHVSLGTELTRGLRAREKDTIAWRAARV